MILPGLGTPDWTLLLWILFFKSCSRIVFRMYVMFAASGILGHS